MAADTVIPTILGNHGCIYRKSHWIRQLWLQVQYVPLDNAIMVAYTVSPIGLDWLTNIYQDEEQADSLEKAFMAADTVSPIG